MNFIDIKTHGAMIKKKTNSSLLFTSTYASGRLTLIVKSTLTIGISQLTLNIIILCVTAVCYVLWCKILASFSICGHFPLTL